MSTNKIEWKRIDNDTCGNPRYVCHFLNLLTQAERDLFTEKPLNNGLYEKAVKRGNKIGGHKYHNKSYGGGIVFQSNNTERTAKLIQELLNAE